MHASYSTMSPGRHVESGRNDWRSPSRIGLQGGGRAQGPPLQNEGTAGGRSLCARSERASISAHIIPMDMAKEEKSVLEAAGREVVITNPGKVFFREAGYTKLDLAKYYMAVTEGALAGIAGRPIVLKRYVNGADEEPFFQKRAPEQHPDWVETVEL